MGDSTAAPDGAGLRGFHGEAGARPFGRRALRCLCLRGTTALALLFQLGGEREP